jgi:uridine kinase
VLVAITGGSGSGKSWLSKRLARALGPSATKLCLDDFYKDRSHLSLARRALLNFDHPRAIDWRRLVEVLENALAGRVTRVPCYDFKTHSRSKRLKVLRPKPIILMEGLWLLQRPAIRRLSSLSIFLECSANTRLRRRIARDTVSRGRTRLSIETQFQRAVEPMHVRYVAPQARLADIVFKENIGRRQIRELLRRLRQFLP